MKGKSGVFIISKKNNDNRIMMKHSVKNDSTSDDVLSMKFDMNTIQHLGISMYSKLPPVIGELIANCYDADAMQVKILMNDTKPNEKSIIIKDDGIGMALSDINQKFLIIGRNRRVENDITLIHKRKAIGRKGIGKLSVFGIAKEIVIITIRNKIKNRFILNLDDILKAKHNVYIPKHTISNKKVNEKNGTTIELRKLIRKSNFKPKDIAYDLAKRFLIYDENFRVEIIHNKNYDEPIQVTNELRFENIEKLFTWTFPNPQLMSDYEFKDEINGKIFTAPSPVPAALKGIYLVARGKLVHNNSFFDIRADDFVHSYITGYLNIDFIDDDQEIDLISTNRESLNWENEITAKLQSYLQEILKFVSREYRIKKKEMTTQYVKDKEGIDINKWVKDLPIQERKLAIKISDTILTDGSLDPDKSAELVSYVVDTFQYETFKEFAAQLEEENDFTTIRILKLFKDWEVIEAKELYKLAIVRIETIKKFKENIDTYVKEKPVMHEFLKTFPWLLDPRIMKLDNEVTFSQLLREKFKEPNSVPKRNRRIDFLCIDLVDTLFIIELKRPGTMVNDKVLDQALEYSAFIKKHKGNDPNFSTRMVRTYVICSGMVNTPIMETKSRIYQESGEVLIKTYHELLSNAIRYHQEFIDKYEEMEKNRKADD